MLVPLFSIISVDSELLAILGDPPRVYPFGKAEADVVYPYAVWQTPNATPENYLDSRCDMDLVTVQMDVYAKTEDDAEAAAQALRSVLEMECDITGYRDFYEPVTKSYRINMTMDFGLER